MKEVLRAYVHPMFIGFLFYLFILLGHNSEFISGDSIKTWSAIISGTIFIYVLVYAVIHKKESIGIATFGFLTAQVLFSIGIPIAMIANKVFFTTKVIETPASLLERDNIELISNSTACYKIKYGTFINNVDTIIRYTKDNRDYERVKSYGFDDKHHRIKWLDSCSYVRISNKESITEYIKIGNIEQGVHQMYERPIATHVIEDETIRTLKELKE